MGAFCPPTSCWRPFGSAWLRLLCFRHSGRVTHAKVWPTQMWSLILPKKSKHFKKIQSSHFPHFLSLLLIFSFSFCSVSHCLDLPFPSSAAARYRLIFTFSHFSVSHFLFFSFILLIFSFSYSSVLQILVVSICPFLLPLLWPMSTQRKCGMRKLERGRKLKIKTGDISKDKRRFKGSLKQKRLGYLAKCPRSWGLMSL